jgi:hypothetical protein
MPITMDALFRRPGRLFVDGEWVSPAGGTSIAVVDSTTEEAFLQVGEANAADMDQAVGAARRAFDNGPRLTHAERAAYLRAFADGYRHQVKSALRGGEGRRPRTPTTRRWARSRPSSSAAG